MAVGSLLLWAAAAAGYSWQEPHAKVLPTGDLRWAPKPFVYEAGESVRYIDFEGGRDENDGLSKERPWKHHPWDPAAEGLARECSGIHTYVFKCGVIYRGQLVARESGEPGHPIRLTSDPAWGTGAGEPGDAAIYGSDCIAGGWRKCTEADVPAGMPDPASVWFIDLGTAFRPRALWTQENGTVTRVPVAREPDWTISNWSDPQAGMLVSDGTPGQAMRLADPRGLAAADPAYVDGMMKWNEYRGNMGTLGQNPVVYDAATKGIGSGAPAGCRFFLENHAAFLDEPGEFYYAHAGPKAGRLFVRLAGDRDPNTINIEASRRFRLVYLPHARHIAITGLRFSFDDVGPRFDAKDYPNRKSYPAAIFLMGSCRDIRIANNRFYEVMSGVIGMTRTTTEGNEKFFSTNEFFTAEWRSPEGPDRMEAIAVADNDFRNVDRRAVSLEDMAPSVLTDIRVLRNRVFNCGARGTNFGWDALPSIHVGMVELCEIAGNMIERAWGCGIVTFGGKGSGDAGREKPHNRILIHHNRVVNSLLASNDWGGIAPWQGGPNYVYNNVSGNAVGPKHSSTNSLEWACNAYAIYLDGTYKSYVFNNIAWGLTGATNQWPRNRGGYMQVLGFLNDWFNNTGYNLMYGFTGWAGQRCLFAGNAFEALSMGAFSQGARDDVSLQGGGLTAARMDKYRQMTTLGYAGNVWYDVAAVGGAGGARGSLEEARRQLADGKAMASQLGDFARSPLFVDASVSDFRPRPGSAVVDRGVKVFVPWSLYAVAGEWRFCRFNADPRRVIGENFYMTEEYGDRHMYYDIPRNDLTVEGAEATDYVQGPLEDWTDGALVFDGTRAAVLRDEDLASDWTYEVTDRDTKATRTVTYPGAARRTVDMGTNSFLIEIVFRAKPGHGCGDLVTKRDETTGYSLGLSPGGQLYLHVEAGAAASVTANATVNDGRWHHVVAEVDRPADRLVAYVDGLRAGEGKLGLAPEASLSNHADFRVGRRGIGFVGAIDFLRVARGTLADAKTTIEELYAWEFDGPFLRDFTGAKPADGKRDAGALEAR